MREPLKSIKIRLADYQQLEELRLQLLKQKGVLKNKLEMLHILIDEAKKNQSQHSN